ncbi:hypothetical protein HEP87_09000 [Streptomyces sp. S1D4-11]
MFLLPETRNMVDVLLDDGYEPWLLDWRGSCRLPYNETGQRYTYDHVALCDIPAAVSHIRRRIGDRPLFVVAHCVGSLTLSLSMTAGLVPGLAGVVSQGVFLTPKLAGRTSLRMSLAGELLRSRIDHIPVDIRKAGLWSKYTPLFALASRGASCPDPTCQILHNSAWGTGASLFVHEHLSEATHHRLAELLGPAPLWILPHLRRIELARTVVRWHDGDHRYRALPQNALDAAARIDTPVLLLALQRERSVARFPEALSRRTRPQTAAVGRRVHRDSRLRPSGHVPRPGRRPRRVRTHPRIPRRTTVTAARAAGYRTRQ